MANLQKLSVPSDLAQKNLEDPPLHPSTARSRFPLLDCSFWSRSLPFLFTSHQLSVLLKHSTAFENLHYSLSTLSHFADLLQQTFLEVQQHGFYTLKLLWCCRCKGLFFDCVKSNCGHDFCRDCIIISKECLACGDEVKEVKPDSKVQGKCSKTCPSHCPYVQCHTLQKASYLSCQSSSHLACTIISESLLWQQAPLHILNDRKAFWWSTTTLQGLWTPLWQHTALTPNSWRTRQLLAAQR